MIRVHCFYPNPEDATSLYRGIGPMEHMKRKWHLDIQFKYQSKLDSWSIIAGYDVLFLQRPYKHEHLQAAKKAKMLGRKVWVDYDDDLFAVPTDNPAHGIYSTEETQKNITYLCAQADVITVSTARLREVYRQLSDRVTVVPNAFNEDLFYRPDDIDIMKVPQAVWRGTSTHDRDVSCFTPQVEKIVKSEAAKKWSWHFQGHNPWFLTDTMPNSRTSIGGAVALDAYFHLLPRIYPSIVWVPLHNSRFNQAKSNIAWIEAIYAGAVCLGPDWDEWRHPGCRNYRDPDDFEKKFMDLIEQYNDPASRTELITENRKAWEYVQQKYSLRFVNLKRKKILADLLDNSGWCEYDQALKAETLQRLRRTT